MTSNKPIKPFILFITGISASGKTTLYESLKTDESLVGVEFHDIDEDGVPPVGRLPWREFRVEQLLFEAVERLENNISTIIVGITKPHEVVESRYYNAQYNVNFLMVDIPMDLFEQRIQKRINIQEKKGTFDEVFNPDAYQELILATKELRRILLNSISAQKNAHSFPFESLSKEAMHAKTLGLIDQIRSK